MLSPRGSMLVQKRNSCVAFVTRFIIRRSRYVEVRSISESNVDLEMAKPYLEVTSRKLYTSGPDICTFTYQCKYNLRMLFSLT